MIRAWARWISDWRNVAAVIASVVVALIAYVVIDASIARNQAVTARDRTALGATRRIDKLNARIKELGDELIKAADSNGARIGALTAQIGALQEQVRQLGGRPVIVVTTTTTTTDHRSAPPTTTTSTTTTTTPRRCIAGVCLSR